MQRANRSSGFSLISVLVSGVIMGIALMAFLSFMTNMQKNISSTRAKATRDEIFANLVRLSNSRPSLLQSATLNGTSSQINRCVNVTAASDCVGNTAAEFSLYDLSGTRVSGTTSSPVRYSVDAAICTTASASCPFEAITVMTPTCPGGAASCAQAVQLAVEVRLQQASGVATVGGDSMRMRERNLASTVDVSEIISSGAQTCATGQLMRGIDATGKIICSAPPATPPDPNAESFGGAWACQLNTSTLNCGGCLSPNPRTGGCSCPAGYTTLKVTGCNSSLYRCGFVCAK